MQTIERKDTLTFHKWNTVGQALDVVITDEPVFDEPNQFGGEDNYFRGTYVGTEDRVQVPMPYDLLAKFKQVQGSIVLGQTHFSIKYTGTKPMKGKAPLKLFEVGVEGLKGEDGDQPF